jgi:putative tricarboxylic transport membrane protein
MTWTDAFATGVANVFSWPGILIPVAGTLLSMIASFLPGIGNASIVMLVMALTMHWEPESVLLMFGALTGGATFMGSITAILFNIPGNVSSTPTLLDGHPLARRGFARTAIACAATASAVGSVFGVIVLLAALPAIRPLLLAFGPLERLLVGIWGLATVIAIPSASHLKAAAMTALGLVAAAIGTDPASGQHRWTFGVGEAASGFNMVAMMLGVFTLAELVEWMRSYRLDPAASAARAPGDSTRNGIVAVFRHLGLTLRASWIGTVVGIIPGVGGTVAGFVAYGHAVQSSADKSGFGQGEIRGVIAPEAAVDAKDGGSLLPAVAFGLPGSEAGVALLAVFAMHGIVPGLPMLTTQLPLTFTLIAALLFSNLLTSAVGVALTPMLAKLRNLRIDRIALPCLIVSLVTVLQVNGVLFDLYTAAAFGVAGYFWRLHGWPRAPFVIAFVLGRLIETNLVLTVQLVELGRIEPLQRPAAIVLAVMILASLAWMRAHRSEVKPMPHAFDADVSVGLVLAGACGVLLATAWWGGAAYSAYVTVLAALAGTLALAAAFRALQAKGLVAKGLRLPVLAAGLAVAREHRLPLVLMAGLPALAWALGLVPAVALAVGGWYAAQRHWRAAALAAAAYGIVTYLFVDRFADLLLPQGALWRLLP